MNKDHRVREKGGGGKMSSFGGEEVFLTPLLEEKRMNLETVSHRGGGGKRKRS